jgi:hypothetical protein
VTHFSLHGKLVEKEKALKPPKSLEQPKTPKKLNEAFEELFTEENDNAHQRLGLCMESENMVVERVGEGEGVLVQYDTNTDRSLREGELLVPASEQFPDLRDCDQESIQETSQEKVSFGALRQRLVVSGVQGNQEGTQTLHLQEGEPVLEPGTEPGAILGTGSAEFTDGTNIGKATSGPKKTLQAFKKGIK